MNQMMHIFLFFLAKRHLPPLLETFFGLISMYNDFYAVSKASQQFNAWNSELILHFRSVSLSHLFSYCVCVAACCTILLFKDKKINAEILS